MTLMFLAKFLKKVKNEMKLKSKKNIETNLLALQYFSALLNDCEHFIFFGTLLGIVREGKPIAGDDDVDFYVNKKDRLKVLKIFKNLKIKIDFNKWPNHTDFFNQIEFVQNGKKLRADFYFFDGESDKYYILEKWHFEAQPLNPEKKLKIPKALIYPITQEKILSFNINLPYQAEVICEFLYGSTWRTPLKKNEEYVIQVMGGKSYLFKKDGIEEKRLNLLP